EMKTSQPMLEPELDAKGFAKTDPSQCRRSVDSSSEAGKKSFHSWSFEPDSAAKRSRHPLPSNATRHRVHEDRLQQFLTSVHNKPSAIALQIIQKRKKEQEIGRITDMMMKEGDDQEPMRPVIHPISM
ncbi:unnamed protein product, partial [Polarella glacialis]